MKRIAVLVLAGMMALSTAAFALKSSPDFAIGAEVTDVNIGTVGAMLTLHIPGLPLYFAFGADFIGGISGGFELTTTLDVWFTHAALGDGYVSFFMGAGLYAVLGFDPIWNALGVRVPLGLQIWPLKNEQFELFLEVAPAWVPLYGGLDPSQFQLQAAAGFRYWTELGP